MSAVRIDGLNICIDDTAGFFGPPATLDLTVKRIILQVLSQQLVNDERRVVVVLLRRPICYVIEHACFLIATV